jgi:anionic cell wall polymer biosynthesis LytR-Cps2A-Psr (LCP) family protein
VKGFLVNDANPRWRNAEGGPDDERDPYAQDPYYQQQPYGYDQYGRPLLQAPPAPPPPQVPQQQGYDTGQQPRQAYDTGQQPRYDTGQQQTYQGQGQDQFYADPAQTYAGQQPGWIPQQPQQPYYEQPPQQQGYDTGQQPIYQPGYDTGRQPRYDTGQHQVYETGQQPVYDTGQHQVYETGQQPVYDTGQHQVTYEQPPAAAPAREPAPERDIERPLHSEQFAFVDEESDDSEEVIDWLKFSESRTERREEARRRGRNRKTALLLVIVLAVVGGAGYLWQSGRLPGTGKSKGAASASGGSQKRDVIVMHMLPVNGGPSSTALLVDNRTKGRGSTVLLPGNLSVTNDDGTATTLDKAVADGVGPTRDSLNTLLGADITGSWRLDTPYLELLVDSLGDVFVDTDTAVKGTGKDSGRTVVAKGEQQELTGQAAVAYATYKAPGETQDKQLARFGQVMQAVLKKMPSDAPSATKVVQSLSQILDPSLTDKQLGASLAQLADLAKTGAYDTTMMPVQKDGTISAQTTDTVVKDVLGGTVKQSTGTGPARVSIKDATGNVKAGPMAQAAILNGGTYTYVAGGKATTTSAASQVVYADPTRLAAAKDVAATLGLPATAVKKGTVPSNADISVLLGKDYKPAPAP